MNDYHKKRLYALCDVSITHPSHVTIVGDSRVERRWKDGWKDGRTGGDLLAYTGEEKKVSVNSSINPVFALYFYPFFFRITHTHIH